MRMLATLVAIVAAATLSPITWGQDFDGVLTGLSASDIAIAPSGDVYVVGAVNRVSKLLDPANVDAGVTSVEFTLVAGSGGAEIRTVAADTNGNVYAAGTFAGTVDFNPGPGTNTLMAPTNFHHAFIVKLDSSLQFMWVKELRVTSGSAATVEAFTIKALAGGVYVGGNWGPDATVDFDPHPTTTHLLTSGFFDGYTLKLDLNGNFQWVQEQNWANSDRIAGLVVDAAGIVYTIGQAGESGSRDITFSKIDAAGNLQWEGISSGNGDATAAGIGIDDDGNVYGAGSFSQTLFLAYPFSTQLCRVVSTSSNLDVFVVKYDDDGHCQWAGRLGGPLSDTANAIAVEPSGTLHVVGTFSGPADFDPGPAVRNLSSTFVDGFIARLTRTGSYAWAWGLGGDFGGGITTGDSAQRVALSGTGGLFMTGTHNVGTDFDPGPAVVHEDPPPNTIGAYLLRLNRIGAGAVPDGGRWVDGVPLTAGKSGTSLVLQWGSACGPLDQDYEVYEGLVGDYTSHVPVVCSTGGASSATIAPSGGDRFYLVVARTDTHEGSYGRDSSGAERAPGASTCLPQASVGDCP